MKCKFCNAEMLAGKDKCDYCGKYQHDFVNDTEEKNIQVEEQKSNGDIWKNVLFFIKVAIAVIIIVVAGYFILEYINTNNSFYGSWRCSNGQLNVVIEKKVFKVKNSSSGFIEADYMLEKEVKEDDNIRYYLDVSATKKLANGSDYVDSNETKFEILMENDNHNKMTLINKETNTSYICYIEKE
jgi:hypothetical protein